MEYSSSRLLVVHFLNDSNLVSKSVRLVRSMYYYCAYLQYYES